MFSGEDAARIVSAALDEDIGQGDITSRLTIPATLRGSVILRARQELVVAGLETVPMVFAALEADIAWQPKAADRQRVSAGEELGRLTGRVRDVLTGERVMLNLLQRMSGVATLTRAYVDAVTGTGAVILDTRKTMPGLRSLDKYSVTCGGGRNHRMRLDDAILIKDNHIAACGSVTEAIQRARAGNAGLPIIVECDTLAQVQEAAGQGIDRILLDNMPPAMLREAIAIIAGRCQSEASGGIDLQTIRAVAESGVDFISVGALTHSAPAVDIGLDWPNQAR